MASIRFLRGHYLLFLIFFLIFAVSFVISLLTYSLESIGDKIGVIEIKGVITNPDEVMDNLVDMGERDDIKAIVLRIDSPGGAVAPSQEIYREVIKIKEEKKKKVVASVGSVAASGGYYIAVASNRIIANQGSITGSIGVIAEFANVEELLGKIGIKGYVIKSGKFKDIGSPLREMSEEERSLLQGVINDIYTQFVEAVSDNRDIPVDKVKRLADGRVFTGRQALKLGLIDGIGNFRDAVKVAAEMVGIKGKPTLVYPPKKEKGLWWLLFGESMESIYRYIETLLYVPQFHLN